LRIRWFAGTRTSSKAGWLVGEPRMPILCSSLPIDTPRQVRLDDKRGDAARVAGLGVCDCETTKKSAMPRFVIQFFSPLMTHSSPSRTARVRMPPGSEPASTSDKANAGVCSPLASPRR
jgi:hypothetical protein